MQCGYPCTARVKWLVGIDVESLYSSIPHETGLDVVKYFFCPRKCEDWFYNAFILESLNYILHRNVFTFDGSHYLQVKLWESHILTNDRMSEFSNHVLVCYRYIDTIFVIWDSTEQLLMEFLSSEG